MNTSLPRRAFLVALPAALTVGAVGARAATLPTPPGVQPGGKAFRYSGPMQVQTDRFAVHHTYTVTCPICERLTTAIAAASPRQRPLLVAELEAHLAV